MTPEIKALYLKAAEVGHRTPVGHISHAAAHLLGIAPEHPRQARRQLQILARLTADLGEALGRHEPATPLRGQS